MNYETFILQLLAMNDLDFEAQFKRVISRKDLSFLENISIFELQSHGEYQVFNKYLITRKEDCVDVKNLYSELIHSFSSMKIALCWCVFDKKGKYADANRIIDLDNRLVGYKINFQIHRKLFRKTKDVDSKLIYLAKFNEDKMQKKKIQQELDRLITQSYLWQQQQYMKTTY